MVTLVASNTWEHIEEVMMSFETTSFGDLDAATPPYDFWMPTLPGDAVELLHTARADIYRETLGNDGTAVPIKRYRPYPEEIH